MTNSRYNVDIDLVAGICGHFTDCGTNNGYGCDHPENEAENPKECHRIGCPVAYYDSDKDEMHVHDKELRRKIKHGILSYDPREYREWVEKQSHRAVQIQSSKEQEPTK